MTSSLVGSEMCIRDRPRTLCPWYKALGYMYGKKYEFHTGGGHEFAQDLFCLLYTSDAADDM
eukprot:1181562-Prorocentrum_lima.AAC.1